MSAPRHCCGSVAPSLSGASARPQERSSRTHTEPSAASLGSDAVWVGPKRSWGTIASERAASIFEAFAVVTSTRPPTYWLTLPWLIPLRLLSVR